MKEPGNQRQKNRSNNGGGKGRYLKSGNESGCQPKKTDIDQKCHNAEGQDRDRESYKLQDGSDKGIDHPDNHGRDNCGPDIGKDKTRDKVGNYEKSENIYGESYYKPHISILDYPGVDVKVLLDAF